MMVLQRLVTFFGALGLGVALALGLLAATPGTAGAVPNGDNAAQLCKTILADPHNAYISQGACVAALTTGNFTPFFTSFCKTDEGRALAEEIAGGAVRNQGQCVTILKAFADSE
jgi:hypothetical protein